MKDLLTTRNILIVLALIGLVFGISFLNDNPVLDEVRNEIGIDKDSTDNVDQDTLNTDTDTLVIDTTNIIPAEALDVVEKSVEYVEDEHGIVEIIRE